MFFHICLYIGALSLITILSVLSIITFMSVVYFINFMIWQHFKENDMEHVLICLFAGMAGVVMGALCYLGCAYLLQNWM